ncbi:MAG: GntR family transcriptional regulator [Bacteroidetes bacterium]|nr:MAG: GntR family transcriptional regulator [Bacteroidota bacterium]
MKFEINHNSPIPLYLQIEQQLRELIKKDEYQQGKLLPNEVDLSRQLGISRNTLRQAINKLVIDGLLVRKKGKGTKVAEPNVSSRVKNWFSFTNEMKAKGIAVRNFELHISWETPSKKLARFFEIPINKKVLKIVKLRGKLEGPFVYFISFMHPMIGFTGEEDFTQPLYELLENNFSTIAKTSKEEITAILANEFIAEKLQLRVNDPVLLRKRFVLDPGGRPIEYNLGYYRGDSFTYSVVNERDIF